MRTANFVTIATLPNARITALKRDLVDAKAAKKTLTRLSLEDLEDCSDNFQEHLEAGYEIDGLEAEIKELERIDASTSKAN